MTNDDITKWDRLMVATLGPVLAAALISTAATLWQVYNQVQGLSYQLDGISSQMDNTYTESQAERDAVRYDAKFKALGKQLDDHEQRLEQLEQDKE